METLSAFDVLKASRVPQFLVMNAFEEEVWDWVEPIPPSFKMSYALLWIHPKKHRLRDVVFRAMISHG